MPPRPFRFGVSAFRAESREDWIRKARRIEELGYSVLGVADHFGEQVSPLPSLAVAGGVTDKLRLATFVLDNDFRHPAVLAKEAATLDLLSGGRLELGIGAGWRGEDYATTGVPFDPPGVRVDRLEEAVAILKGLWREGPFSFSGSHFTITELEGFPKPVQQPRPPLFIGGGGRRVLSLAAREADIVGLLPQSKRDGSGMDPAGTTIEALERRIAIVREAAGKRFEDIELNLLIQAVHITDEPLKQAESMTDDWSMAAEDILRVPEVLIGTHEDIAAKLEEVRSRFGISYFTVFGNVYEEFAPVVALLSAR